MGEWNHWLFSMYQEKIFEFKFLNRKGFHWLRKEKTVQEIIRENILAGSAVKNGGEMTKILAS